MNEKFENAFREYGDDKPRIKDMIMAILWIRLFFTVLIILIALASSCCFCKMTCSSDPAERSRNRKILENLYIILIPVQYDIKRRQYDNTKDEDITCAICLGDLKDQ